MANLKTVPTNKSVHKFLNGIKDEQRRKECFKLLHLIAEITKTQPVMWGSAIVGFGKYHYKYESGREGDWFLAGFSPRKQNLTMYIMSGFKNYNHLMQKLGKYKTGSSCLYIKSLTDIDRKYLTKLIQESVKHIKTKYD